MTELDRRVRAALADGYAVDAALAHGGMGIVFKGRDRALDRPVAIKIIRPDRASASAVERFLREGRVLASLRHPNIVTVHHAGEADGIAYYVMELLEGETLAERRARGGLTAEDISTIALDVLAALAAAHAGGIVHRDVKPSNVFLQNGRAILTDFGIAKQLASDEALTLPDVQPGTPGYMAPEQVAGGAVTTATDVCAAGMMLYEAYTGQSWSFDAQARPGWHGVPRRLTRVLAKALAPAPAARWQDAGEMRRAFAQAQARSAAPAWGVAGALVLVAAVALAWPWRTPAAAGSVTLAVMPLHQRGGGAPGLGDSIAAALRDGLRGTYDFTVLPDTAPATIRLGGTIRTTGDSIWITVRPDSADDAGQNVTAEWRGPGRDWPQAVDSLTRALLVRMLSAYTTMDLPGDALPHTPEALTAWARAETRFARSEWNAAKDAYLATLAIGECLLCEVRLLDIRRWQRVDSDARETQHFLRERWRFPPRYQTLIAAGQAPLAERLALLDGAVSRDSDFWAAYVALADEILHRGPLVGRPRGDAIALFNRALALRPDFAPAWEHLAHTAIAENRPQEALAAMQRYDATAASTDVTSQVLRYLNAIAFAWRFQSAEAGRAALSQTLRAPGMATFPDLAAGPRYFLSLDAPDAALWLSRWFADSSGRRDLLAPGLAGQAVAHLALGQRDSARAAARRLQARDGGVEAALFATQLDAMMEVLDSIEHRDRWPALAAELSRLAALPAATPLQRRRAAWTLALAARRYGDTALARPLAVVQERDAGGRRPFATLLEGLRAAGGGDPGRALSLTAPLLDLDSAGRAGDPFFRTALHLLRGEWALAAGDTALASSALLWHQNSDMTNATRGVAQPVDVDAGFATLGRWRQAAVLQRVAPGAPETCAALAGVARLWAHGDPPRARRALAADSVRRAQGCAG